MRPMKPRLPGLALLLVLAFCLPARADDQELEVRVLTFNVWGVPLVSTHRAARWRALEPAIKVLDPKIVALQEVFYDEDVEALSAMFRRLGFEHVFRHPHRVGGGLLTASRFPIRSARFEAYRAAGRPHSIARPDFWAGKGIAILELETPLGLLRFANSHLHAQYGRPEEFKPTVLAQAIQASESLEALGLQPGAPAGSRPPLILGGDINSAWDDLPFQVLAARAALLPAAPELGIDALFSRSGSELSIRSRGARSVFAEPVELDDGVRQTLSDHKGIVGDFTLRVAPSKLEATPVKDWKLLQESAARLLSEAIARRRRSRLICGAVALLLIGAALALARRKARSKRLKKVALTAIGLGVLAALYFALIYEPMALRALEEAYLTIVARR